MISLFHLSALVVAWYGHLPSIRLREFHLGNRECIDLSHLDSLCITQLLNVGRELLLHCSGGYLFPSLQRLLMILRIMAPGSFQEAVAVCLNVSQSSVSRCLHKFLYLVLANEFIKFPNHKEMASITRGYLMIASITDTVGVADAVHISIVAPMKKD